MLNYLNSGDYSKIDTTLANFKKIAKNIPAFVTTNPEALDLITRGIGCMAPAFQSRSLSSIAAGAPVKFIFPKEGGLYIGGDTYITRNAPHPIAAQMAANALLSLESQQEALEKAGNSGVHLKLKKPSTGTAASVTLASEFKSVPGGMRFIPLSAYNNLDDWVRKWNEMASTR
jgi:putative spermidine/putrescine transport system substrate-binding protein